MLNHKTIFKQKSKILLTILCIFGLLFSYSCSCRNESTGPKWEDDDKKDGNTLTGGVSNNKGGMAYTPSTTLSRSLMVVKSDASDTSYPITITVKNADVDFNSSTITTSGGSLTKEDFDFANGVLKVKKEKLASVKDTAKETYKLTLKFITNSLFGENDTLSTETDTEKTFELIKAKKYTDNDFQTQLQTIGSLVISKGSIKFYDALIQGVNFEVSEDNEVDREITTSEFIATLKKKLTEVTTTIKGIEEVKEPNISSDKKTATFYVALLFDETIETDTFNKEIPLQIRYTLKSTDNKVIWVKQ